MPRVIYGRGARGATIARLQHGLAIAGNYTGTVDGIYGGGTDRAVRVYQRSMGVADTGKVDELTWTAITKSPIPEISIRCLDVTAAFEGHGFGMVAGNYDGALLTWGIIGFTLRYGQIQQLVSAIWSRDPSAVKAAFGDETERLLELMTKGDKAALEVWADSISIPPSKHAVLEPWRSAFMRLGTNVLMQEIQLEAARDRYFNPCLETAARLSLKSELGIALAFDIHVQNGEVSQKIEDAARAMVGGTFSLVPEEKIRIALANAIANDSIDTYREDVRSRKLTLSTGRGTVHGEPFILENWGLQT